MRHFNTTERRVYFATTVQLSKRGLEAYRTAFLKLLSDSKGQDFLEYALIAGFVATCAATISPNVASGAGVMFSKVTSAINVAGS